jgi:hypothetical protein
MESACLKADRLNVHNGPDLPVSGWQELRINGGA